MKRSGHSNKPKRKGHPPFKPTEDQRALVKLLSGLKVNQDQIRLLLLNQYSNKPISKVTLHRHFKAELETGNVALKELIARKFVDALEAGESWATRLGLKNKYRWSIADNGALPAELLSEGNSEPSEMRITFVMPSRREPEPLDLTPTPSPYANAEPDLSRPALEPPRPRQSTPFGAVWEKPAKGTDWMR